MSGFETNIVEVWEEFKDLTKNDMTKAIKRALNKAAAKLQEQTKANLRTMIKSDTGGHGKFNDRLSDGVMRRNAGGNYDEDLYAVVHVMGSQATGSGTYRLRMLEKGTKERYAQRYKGEPLMKPRYTGAIKPMWFFKSANATIESQLESIYIDEIDNAIEKINSNKG